MTFIQALAKLNSIALTAIDESLGALGKHKPIVASLDKAPSHEDMRRASAPFIEINDEIFGAEQTTIGRNPVYEVSGRLSITTDTNTLPESYPLRIVFSQHLLDAVRRQSWSPMCLRNIGMTRITAGSAGVARHQTQVNFDYVFNNRGA